MNWLIKKMFFRNIALKTYFPVRISEGEIEERVILKNQSQSIDVSQRHNLICLEPFVIAIWLTRQFLDGFISDCGDLHIKTGAKINASLKISLLTQLEFKNNNLLLYRIENAKCHQFHWIYNNIILACSSAPKQPHSIKDWFLELFILTL